MLGAIFIPYVFYACYLYVKKSKSRPARTPKQDNLSAKRSYLHVFSDSCDLRCSTPNDSQHCSKFKSFSANLTPCTSSSVNSIEVNANPFSLQFSTTGKTGFAEPCKGHCADSAMYLFHYPPSTLLERDNLPPPFIRLIAGVETQSFVRSPLTSFLIGKGPNGENIIEDMQFLSHLLVTGTTGSGKSSFLHSIIISLLFKCNPDEVRFILVDTKVVEFAPYNGVPHLLFPVLTDPAKAVAALQWLTTEVSKRFRLFQEYNVWNLSDYNDFALKEGISLLPSIFFIVDELFPLMAVGSFDTVKLISSLVRTSTSTGVHLILSTQYSMKSIIPDSMGFNIPSRITFSVNTRAESRFVLGVDGAENLNVPGELLFLKPYNKIPIKAQSYFTSFDDVKSVTKFLYQNK